MKHIFTSQATLNLGRNRSHRKLEAKLDNLSRTTTIPKELIEEPRMDCPHYLYCNIRVFGRINCLFGYKNCQTYKFYEKYPNYGEMFVGSRK